MVRHGRRKDYSRPDVSPLVAAMRTYLMWEYGDEFQPVPPSTPEKTAVDPDHASGQNQTSRDDQ
jgi:hypothetical protein